MPARVAVHLLEAMMREAHDDVTVDEWLGYRTSETDDQQARLAWVLEHGGEIHQ